jgi:hypothetical protein
MAIPVRLFQPQLYLTIPDVQMGWQLEFLTLPFTHPSGYYPLQALMNHTPGTA